MGIGGLCAAAPGDWASYAGAPGGGQYSPLTQITPDNVGRLRIAWSFRTGELGAGLPDPERRRFEANPLVLGGRMYLTTGTGIAFALDAASGRELWSFDAKVRRDKHYSDPASRGVSFWRDTQAAAGACRERIVFGTLDARLIALDAVDGRPCAGFGKGRHDRPACRHRRARQRQRCLVQLCGDLAAGGGRRRAGGRQFDR